MKQTKTNENRMKQSRINASKMEQPETQQITMEHNGTKRNKQQQNGTKKSLVPFVPKHKITKNSMFLPKTLSIDKVKISQL